MQLPALVDSLSGGSKRREEAGRAAREANKKQRVASVAVAPRQKSERAAGKAATRRIRAQVVGAHAVASDKDEDEYSISTGGSPCVAFRGVLEPPWFNLS